MTAEPAAHAMWSPDPIEQRLTSIQDTLEPDALLARPFEIKLPIRDITP